MATKKKFIELQAQGLSLQSIAKSLRVGKALLVEWNRELREEIATAKAIELEALQEEYFMTREGKARLFGEKVRQILSEIAQRDLKDVTTTKLFDLLAQYYGLLGEEIIEPVFKTPEEIRASQEGLAALETMAGMRTDSKPGRNREES